VFHTKKDMLAKNQAMITIAYDSIVFNWVLRVNE
jgi:hypothetical protein